MHDSSDRITLLRLPRVPRALARPSSASLALVLLLGLLLLLPDRAQAAEIVGGEIYRLEEGQVIQDDLYVSAGEVIINGTVEGDLVVTGGYVEINGIVTEDLWVAGAGIVVNGVVEDDARLAGASVTVAGNIQDDLFMAGGGAGPGAMAYSFPVNGHTITPGVRLVNTALVEGDAFVAGGNTLIAGRVDGDLFAAAGAVQFLGRVDGDANLYGGSVNVAEGAQVGGTLRYRASDSSAIADGVAADVQEAPASVDAADQVGAAEAVGGPVRSFLGWLWRTVLLLAGFALLGWLLLRLAPGLLHRPTAALTERPLEAGLLGLLLAFLVVPLSAGFVFLGVLFWGWFPGGVVTFAFLFGGLALIWLLSPLVIGLWLGDRITTALGMARGPYVTLITGAFAVVLLARLLVLIPCVGELAMRLLYLGSFALAVGAAILLWRQARTPVPTGAD